MKRLSIVFGILAITFFIAYHFLFADRRSRLKLDDGEIITTGSSDVVQASFKQSGFTSLQSKRMLVREGTLILEVKNLAEARAAISKLTTEFNGYVTSEIRKTTRLVIRGLIKHFVFPFETTEEFVRQIEVLALRVDERKISALDVTEEFIDVESRLITKKKMEARYHEIFKKATTINEIMDLERHINVVRSDIESMEGRMLYLKNQSSFSTIYLVLFEPKPEPLIAATGFGKELTDSLKLGWSGILLIVKWLATIWPLLIIGGLIIWMYFRRKLKHRHA